MIALAPPEKPNQFAAQLQESAKQAMERLFMPKNDKPSVADRLLNAYRHYYPQAPAESGLPKVEELEALLAVYQRKASGLSRPNVRPSFKQSETIAVLDVAMQQLKDASGFVAGVTHETGLKAAIPGAIGALEKFNNALVAYHQAAVQSAPIIPFN